MLHKLVFTLVAVSLSCAAAGHAGAGKIPAGSRLFIAEMEGELHGFIAPEIVKRQVPFVVVVDDKDADYVLTGASIRNDDRWYHTVFGGKDKNEGNVQLISVKEKRVVWAGEAGDRSLWWSWFRRGGQRKVADRIVKKLKEDLFRQ